MPKVQFAPNVLSTVPPSTFSALRPRSSRSQAQHESTFPIEVYERIIDFVATQNWDPIHPSIWAEDIFATLQSCALTCRAWVPRSQRYLFRSLGASASPSASHTLSELYTLLDTHPHLRAHVHALSVHGTDASALHALPLNAPSALPHLTRLHISDAPLFLAPGALPSLRRLTTLRTLHLRGVLLPAPQDLRRTVSALSALRELSIEWPRFGEIPAPAPTRVAQCKTRLAELLLTVEGWEVRGGWVAWFLEWVVRAGVVRDLEFASLTGAMCVDGRMVDAVAALLRAAANYVFDVGLSWAVDVDPTPLYGPLAQCSQLEFLGLILPYHSRTVKQLAALLGKIRARCEPLNITLVRHIPTCVEPTSEDWAALDAVLNQRQWRYAKYVFFDRYTLPCVKDDEPSGADSKKPLGEDWTWTDVASDKFYDGKMSEANGKEWEDMVKRVLPRTYKKGILRRSRLGDGYFQDVVKIS